MTSLNTFIRLTPLAAAILLAACATEPTTPIATTPVKPVVNSVPTLASLDSIDLKIAQNDKDLVALKSQVHRVDSAPTATVGEMPEGRELAPTPQTLDEQVDSQVSERMYNQLITQARKAPDPGTANAYLQVARKLRGNNKFVAQKDEQAILEENVEFYQDLLKRMPAAESKAEIYYDLAKTYDLLGKKDESLATLKTLAEQYPQSQNLTEINFRLGEASFSQNHFMQAAKYYGEVLNAPESEFTNQAMYRRGWSLYRASDYEGAMPMFFGFAEKLMYKPKKTAQESAALQDALDVISLNFMQQEDGIKALDDYFEHSEEKPYEQGIYVNLAQAYLGKKMYTNAAKTYESFVNRHPFDPTAPQLSTAIINIYQAGGFYNDMTKAKGDFIDHYGVDSVYWQQADEETRNRLSPLLMAHLKDLATEYHAKGQDSHNPDDYLEAAKWYRASMKMATNEPDAIATNRLLAEVLYHAKHYEEAITEFENIAYHYNQSPKADESASFALLCYKEWDDSLGKDEEAHKKLFTKRSASIYHFAETFPQNENTPLQLGFISAFIQKYYDSYDDNSKPLIAQLEAGIIQYGKDLPQSPNNEKLWLALSDVYLNYSETIEKRYSTYDDNTKAQLTNLEAGITQYNTDFPQSANNADLWLALVNLYLHYKDNDNVLRTGQVLLHLNPPAPEASRLETLLHIADILFDKKQFAEAEQVYRQAAAFNTADNKKKPQIQARLSASLSQQGESLIATDPDKASALYLQASQEVGIDEAHRQEADWNAVRVYLQVADDLNKKAEAVEKPIVTAATETTPATNTETAKPTETTASASGTTASEANADSTKKSASELHDAEKAALQKAIPLLLAYQSKYPNDSEKQIPERLRDIYGKTGDKAKLAEQYLLLASEENKKKKKNTAMINAYTWKAAETYEAMNDTSKALPLYTQYANDTSNPADARADAYSKLLADYQKKQQSAQVDATLKNIAQLFDKAGNNASSRLKYLGAMSHFQLAQPLFDKFVATPIADKNKRANFDAAMNAYTKVININVADFITGSKYQQAELLHHFADDIKHIPAPQGIDPDDFQLALDEKAAPFIKQSLELHKQNSNLVKEQEIYDDYVAKSYAALAELQPGRYNRHEQLEDSIDIIY